jgi:putative membrane protein
MVVREAILAYAHFISIFALIGTVVAELVLFRKSMPAGIFRRLQVVDRWYGITAGLVVVTGLARLNLGLKGALFYTENPVFWTKISLFVAAGLISIIPTVLYIRWKSRPVVDGSIELSGGEYTRVRSALWLQAVLYTLIPLCASLMAVHL